MTDDQVQAQLDAWKRGQERARQREQREHETETKHETDPYEGITRPGPPWALTRKIGVLLGQDPAEMAMAISRWLQLHDPACQGQIESIFPLPTNPMAIVRTPQICVILRLTVRMPLEGATDDTAKIVTSGPDPDPHTGPAGGRSDLPAAPVGLPRPGPVWPHEE
jgi:hypothetical protein